MTAATIHTLFEAARALRLFVGGQALSLCGGPDDLPGDRCWTAAHPCQARPADPAAVRCLLDSGAFTDPPGRRLTPEGALARQLAWEGRASGRFGLPWRCEALVSYDRLIDETWAGGRRRKRRWTLAAAESAVRETVDAAAYLSRQRDRLAPRALVLAAQGVDAEQYRDCAGAVLAHARPGDWLGLGGWCLLGRAKRLLPEFWRTCRAVLPLARDAGVGRVHLFGVLWLPALGGLLWLCDRFGLKASCDSAAPVLAFTRGDRKKAGCRAPDWRANVAWWREALGGLRGSPHYREPRRAGASLFEGVP